MCVCVCLQPSCTCTEIHSSQYAPATGSWKEFEHERSTLQVGTLAWLCKSSCANQKKWNQWSHFVLWIAERKIILTLITLVLVPISAIQVFHFHQRCSWCIQLTSINQMPTFTRSAWRWRWAVCLQAAMSAWSARVLCVCVPKAQAQGTFLELLQ